MKNFLRFLFLVLPYWVIGQVVVDSAAITLNDNKINAIAKSEKTLDSFLFKGLYQAAESVALTHLDLVKYHLGEQCPDYVSALTKAAKILPEIGKYLQADSCLGVADRICEAAGKQFPPEVRLEAILQRVNVRLIMAQFDSATFYWEQARLLAERTLPMQHPLHTDVIFYKGYCEHNLRNYTIAEPFFKKAIEQYDSCGAPCAEKNVVARYCQAALWSNAGQNHKALNAAKRLRELCLQTYGEGHPFEGRAILSMAVYSWRMGDNESAELLYLQALSLLEKGYGKSSIKCYIVQYNLADLYLELGQTEKAKTIALYALEIEKQVLGTGHNAYPMSLAQVGNILLEQGQLEQAEPYLQEAKVLRAQMLTTTHPHYAASLELLGKLYMEKRDWVQARSFFEEELQVLIPKQGERHQEVAYSRFLLSRCLFEMGDLEAAEREASLALDIFQEVFDDKYFPIIKNLDLLAVIFARMGKIDEAICKYNEALAMQEKLLRSAASYASTQEMEARLRYFRQESAILQTTACAWQANKKMMELPKTVSHCNANFGTLVFDNALLHKGLLLQNSQEQLSAILNSQDTIALRQHNELKATRQQLSTQYAKPVDLRNGVAELEEKANALEKYLARHTAKLVNSKAAQVRCQELQAYLRHDEAALEFVHFQVHNPTPSDSVIYLAALIRPGWERPKMAYLCEQRQLDSLLNENDATAAVQKLYATRGVTPGGKALSPALYRLLWQPLDSLLEGVTTVHFSPSGSLHRIAFNAIPTPAERGKAGVLADRYKLNQLFSTRSLVVQPVAATPERQAAALFGGISYETNWSADSTSTDSTELAYVPLSTSLLNPNRGHRGDGWGYLPGTKAEVDRLSKLLAKRGYGTATFTDTVATEERFKQLGVGSPSPTILHIATHGFFFPDPALKKSQGMDFGGSTSIPLSEHPLMRSGLLLAGANKAWKEGKPLPGREDGILTAYEIAQVNLTGTKLAVLSACETGLGDIQGSEGVMGLQRSLKMAGAEKLIVSLWAVPDKESAVFMERFYTKWLSEGKEIRDAFYETQQWMRKRYKDPLVWAGFVLVE